MQPTGIVVADSGLFSRELEPLRRCNLDTNEIANRFRRTDLDSTIRSDDARALDALSAVSWGSIAAGAVTIAAVTLILIALGVGLGLSSISPWSDSGLSAGTFKVGAGIYLVIVSVMSSAIGGYLASRLRAKWIGVHSNEAFFRDSAHGLVAWAFATVISASVLGTATTHLVGAAASGVSSIAGATQANSTSAQPYVDRLFRQAAPATPAPTAAAPANSDNGSAAAAPPAPAANANRATRDEVGRLWTASIGAGGQFSADDRTYVARLIAAQTGLSQADAEKRVDEVVQQAKTAADNARRGTAKLAFWMTAALLFGAFAASLAAVEGGQHRDGTWNDRRLVPRV